MKIVLASKNPKKALEVERMMHEFGRTDISVVCLKDIPEASNIAQAEENGSTFLENARIKAEYWAKVLNIPALGEDSGIEIDALDGAPGVYTKRAISKYCPGQDINEDKPSIFYPQLLKAMASSGNPSKRAGWISAMVLAFPNSLRPNIEVKNTLYGQMCECAGTKEFGFDQYFIPENAIQTLSEMEPSEKDAIGPRRKSLQAILNNIA